MLGFIWAVGCLFALMAVAGWWMRVCETEPRPSLRRLAKRVVLAFAWPVAIGIAIDRAVTAATHTHEEHLMQYKVTAVTPTTLTYEDHTKPKQKVVGGLRYPTTTIACDNGPGTEPIAPGDHIEIVIRKVLL